MAPDVPPLRSLGPFWALVRADALIGLRGRALRAALAMTCVVGWFVGNAPGTGAGLSALNVGNTACVYVAFVAIYLLSMAAGRDDAVGAASIVLSKPQPTERLVLIRFVGAYAQVLLLVAALFAGAMASRVAHTGSVIGCTSYALQFARASIVLFCASSAAYGLALMAGTPIAGALAGLYWIVTLAGQEYLAKLYYPYYTQNVALYAVVGAFVLSLAALTHRRRRRGLARPQVWARWGPLLTLLAGAWLAALNVRNGHDPMMREAPLMGMIAQQDASPGNVSPGFLLPDQRGRLVSLADTPGRVFVVGLLDPQTAEGAQMLDRLNALHKKYGSRGVLPVAVCIANDTGAAATLAWGAGVAFPVLSDWGSHHAPKITEASPVASAFRATDLPYVAVTDRRRRIRDQISGTSAYDSQEVERAILRRLEEEPR